MAVGVSGVWLSDRRTKCTEKDYIVTLLIRVFAPMHSTYNKVAARP